MADTLNVVNRNEKGTSRMRRLRETGVVPAVLYGHGEENVNLCVEWRELDAVLAHGGHIVKLVGAVKEDALIREVQWDHVAQCCLHVDLTRVSADEEVEVTIKLQVKGVAKGINEGGIVTQHVHDVEISCRANQIPDKIEVDISELGLADSIRASELKLPDGATLVNESDITIVSCELPVEEDETASSEEGAAVTEPELIDKGKGDAEEESDE